jgi:hypothetical protein
MKWRPQVSALNKGSDINDQSFDETDNDSDPEFSPGPTFSPVPLPRSLRRRCNRSEDEVEQDVISISSRSGKKFNFCVSIHNLTIYNILLALDHESSAPVPKVSIPTMAKSPTPPCVEAIQDSFHSSINFDDEENPWVPQALDSA